MSENKENNKQIVLKPYTLNELAKLYGVNFRTLKVWLEPFLSEIGEKKGRYYQIPQVRIIFKKLDLPSKIDIE